LTGDRPATLGDVLAKDAAQIEGMDVPPYYHAQYGNDPGVHQTRINILLVDGHAESVDISPHALQRFRLTD
jgi:prepilin-type processing-associated H-X9-DG protein